jgi:hypothetical protein
MMESRNPVLNVRTIRRSFGKSLGTNIRARPPSPVFTCKAPKEEISVKNPTTQKSQFGRTATEEDREEQIRRRAYELYELRGREDGHDVEDWLAAEAEITGTTRKATAA